MNYKDHFKALLAKYHATLEDAPEQLHLNVSKGNVTDAIAYAKKHPGSNGLLSCPLVQAGKDPANNKGRTKVVEVMVGNKVANVIFEVPKGRKAVYVARRYTLPKATQDMIIVFDATKVFTPGDYLFDKPSPGRRLDYKAPKKVAGEKRTYVVGSGERPASFVPARDTRSEIAA